MGVTAETFGAATAIAAGAAVCLVAALVAAAFAHRAAVTAR